MYVPTSTLPSSPVEDRSPDGVGVILADPLKASGSRLVPAEVSSFVVESKEISVVVGGGKHSSSGCLAGYSVLTGEQVTSKGRPAKKQTLHKYEYFFRNRETVKNRNATGIHVQLYMYMYV